MSEVRQPKVVAMEAVPKGDGRQRDDLFIVVDGVRVARRGYPGTPQAKTWVSIEPGYEVRDKGKRGLIVRRFGVSVQ
jgi:hypothetical protein